MAKRHALKLDAALLQVRRAAGQDRDVFEHRLAAVAEGPVL